MKQATNSIIKGLICSILLLSCNHDSTQPEKPEATRFTKIELVNDLVEPMELAVLPSGNVLFIERKGAIKVYQKEKQTASTLFILPVFSDLEDGLLGLALDPDFLENNFFYLYYSPVEKDVQRVSRFSFRDEQFDVTSEKILIEIPVQRKECCHSAGSLAFGPDKTLFIAVGDNTNPHNPGYYNSTDERAGREFWDAQRTAANTNDLRGKILRIKPMPDGSYSIPVGNLFPKDSKTSRPEIYAMGCRNPYRIQVDQQTGYLYWGDVGQNTEFNPARGPISYDEFNQAKSPGFFGWPYFAGNNQAYTDYNWETNVNGPFYDSLKPINNSRNNTGDTLLPRAQSAFIWYSYPEDSSRFKHLGSGGKSPIAGPVYRITKNVTVHAFPKYYEGKWFIAEWMRDWINVVDMDEQGNLKSIERFMPGTVFDHPIDLEFSHDGLLYVLEYGPLWFSGNKSARLSRIEYNSGNRAPVVVLNADKREGGVPLTVNFTAAQSFDYDKGDKLNFTWTIANEPKTGTDIIHTFNHAGEYQVTLTATDEQGSSQSKSITIQAGNDPPAIHIGITGNQTFFWPKQLVEYAVSVTDTEDKDIDQSSILVKLEPIDIGLGKSFIASQLNQTGHEVALSTGAKLIASSDCKSCHHATLKSVGPSYTDIAKRYPNREETIHLLAGKIIKGGSGNWGETAMSAHPQISTGDAQEITRYLLESYGIKRINQLPAIGSFKPEVTEQDYLITATYADKGNAASKPITKKAYRLMRWPELYTAQFDDAQYFSRLNDGVMRITQTNGYLKFNQLDLRGITEVTYTLTAPTQGTLELRIGSPEGKLISSVRLDGLEVKPRTWASIASKLTETDGVHDCYFVFKGNQLPLDMVRIRFASN